MGDTAKNPFVLPIFDTNYTVDLVWSAGDTIDVGMLKKVGLKKSFNLNFFVANSCKTLYFTVILWFFVIFPYKKLRSCLSNLCVICK